MYAAIDRKVAFKTDRKQTLVIFWWFLFSEELNKQLEWRDTAKRL